MKAQREAIASSFARVKAAVLQKAGRQIFHQSNKEKLDKRELKWPLVIATIAIFGYAIFRVGQDLSPIGKISNEINYSNTEYDYCGRPNQCPVGCYNVSCHSDFFEIPITEYPSCSLSTKGGKMIPNALRSDL